MKYYTLILLLALTLSSCWDFFGRRSYSMDGKVLGYRPVYSQDSTLKRIYTDTARAIRNAGKIYAIGNLVLQNEQGLGLHVIDRSDPANMRKLGFIRIAGNTEVSIKGNHLYANSFGDLVVVDVSDWRQAREVNRIPFAFQHTMVMSYSFAIPPPEKGVHFDCSYRPDMGVQTGWVKDSIPAYSCYYQ